MRTLILSVVFVAAVCKKDAPSPVGVVAEKAVAAAAAVPGIEKQADGSDARVISMKVTEDGFVPGRIAVKQGELLKMRITRVTDSTCATEILIDGTDIKTPLPLNMETEVSFRPAKAGAIKFGCAMDKMVSGVLLVD